MKLKDKEFIKYFRKQGKIYLIHKTNKDLWWIYKKRNKEHTLPPAYVKVNYYNDVADTIEELCDEFIAFNSFQEQNTYRFLEDFKEAIYWFKNYTNIVIYGAIWTDKGLIYVAKMNENGTLELL